MRYFRSVVIPFIVVVVGAVTISVLGFAVVDYSEPGRRVIWGQGNEPDCDRDHLVPSFGANYQASYPHTLSDEAFQNLEQLLTNSDLIVEATIGETLAYESGSRWNDHYLYSRIIPIEIFKGNLSKGIPLVSQDIESSVLSFGDPVVCGQHILLFLLELPTTFFRLHTFERLYWAETAQVGMFDIVGSRAYPRLEHPVFPISHEPFYHQSADSFTGYFDLEPLKEHIRSYEG